MQASRNISAAVSKVAARYVQPISYRVLTISIPVIDGNVIVVEGFLTILPSPEQQSVLVVDKGRGA